MSPTRIIYNLLLLLASGVAPIAARFNAKISEGLEGRKGFKGRWLEGAGSLARKGPLVWFHVSSVGEFEQAKPVMDLLVERMGGDVELALTFYSPSGMNYFRRFDRSKRNPAITFVEYLPIDTIGNMRFCLDTLKPDLIVYVKFDLWPNLILEARRLQVPQILVSGTLAPSSHRLWGPARGFFGSLYGSLNAIAAISDDDARRFRENLKGTTEVITAGDTRFDQVCRRIDGSTVTLPPALGTGNREFIIAGSTWPRDEAVVIPGFRLLLDSFPEVGLIVVPHEPIPQRLTEIEEALDSAHLTSIRLSALERANGFDEQVVIADGIGYLAELYRNGCLAYVGGSFTTGVHNVMEPAVLGLPILFGPKIDNSYEARQLLERGVGAIVEVPEGFAREAGALLSDRKLLQTKGQTGSTFIRNHCGAALHCIDLINRHIRTKG
jgi:3-deoxy-D-manno-octulosonic-acid transferase